MCGRYTLHTNKAKLAEAIALAIPEEWEPDYNIGPGRETLSIASKGESKPVVRMMHWGLRTPQNFHINARIETADTSPRFRESWHERRCLLPVNGFYEWYQDGITKQPYYIYPMDRSLHCFAGIWFPSTNAGGTHACVVLTRSAQESIHHIHDRMPVILRSEQHNDWLNNRLAKCDMLTSSSDIELGMHPVSRRVNSVQNKDSRLIEATLPATDDQMMLF
jgi:putative SOS response-associated peptidase YedK